jgi:hypothetical protein
MVSVRRKATLRPSLAVLVVAGALLAGGLPATVARPSEPVASDWRTGLAIYGVDPVAYFTEGGVRLGRGEHEFVDGPATWRFRNAGNRAAFIERPDIYRPQFGGYDPIALGDRRVAVPGHPDYWLMLDGRLYLFSTSESRASFQADRRRAISSANHAWAAVRDNLLAGG